MDGRAVLQSFFLTGEKPTQGQFADLIDSCFNLVDDTITISMVSGLSSALAGFAPAFSGSAGQYVKGNGTYAMLGLSDITAALGFTPENVANKATNTLLGTSDTLYPSQNAVKTYVDTAIAGVSGGSESWASITGTPTTLSGYGITDALSAATAAATYQPIGSYLTGINSGEVTTALGFTPQEALSGTGYVKISGTTISYDNSTYLTTASAAASYQPIGSYLTGITSAEIALALGYTPQAALSGTGFVKISGTTISYDNSTYLTTAAAAGTYAPLASPAFTGTPSFSLGSDAIGDIYYRNSSGVLARLGIGSAGQVLAVAGGLPGWSNVGAGVTSTSNTDGTLTVSPMSGTVVASLNLAHANTWTTGQTISYNGVQLTLSSPSSTVTFQAYGTNNSVWTGGNGGLTMAGWSQITINGGLYVYGNAFNVTATGTQVAPLAAGSSGTFNCLGMLPTVNQSGTAGYTAIFANVTETAIGSGSKYLALLQVGSVTKFQIDHLGNTAASSLRGVAVTFANLPSSPAAGMLVEVTDCTVNTWGSPIVGGGSYTVLAHYNGVNWTVAGI